jgi:hypothetical protein
MRGRNKHRDGSPKGVRSRSGIVEMSEEFKVETSTLLSA